MLHGILRWENLTYTYRSLQRGMVLKWFYGPPLQRRMVLQCFIHRGSESLKHLCQRYMGSTEYPSSFGFININLQAFLFQTFFHLLILLVLFIKINTIMKIMTETKPNLNTTKCKTV